LARVVASPAFRASERSCAFLSYIVEAALEGRHQEIKERNIGVAIFGRAPDYDTPSDPIVRVRANEVRKRLATFYRDSETEDAVRFELSPGTYIPTFHWTAKAVPAVEVTPAVEAAATDRPSPLWGRPRLGVLFLAAAALLLLVSGVAWWWSIQLTPIESFWRPMARSAKPPVLLLGIHEGVDISHDLRARVTQAPTPSASIPARRGDFVLFTDFHVSTPNLRAAVAISGVLGGMGKTLLVRTGGNVGPEDVRRFSVISIGAFNNPWTMSRLGGLRFSLAHVDGQNTIRDRNNPAVAWVADGGYPWTPQTVDYAVITRVSEPETGDVYVSAAGINSFGTQVAGEFLSDPAYWPDLVRHLPRGWEDRNLQFVLKTNVVGMTPSRPQVVATHVW